jgi:hypothetical protein
MRQILCVALVSAAFFARSASAIDLLTDPFSSNASATNYTEVSVNQTQLTYGFDYSTMGIPPAPGTTDSSTLGLKMEANMSQGAQSAVTLHTVQQFTGAYTVEFDAWINANGPFPDGGTGSTEALTAGVGGDTTTVNGSSSSSNAQTGSGAWVAVTGEGGGARDYRAHKNASEQFSESTQFAAGTGSSAGAGNPHDSGNAYYAGFGQIDVGNLPVQGANNGGPAQQTGTSLIGSAGFAWRKFRLEVNPTGGTGGATQMDWFIDDLRIGELDRGIGTVNFSTAGSVTLGYWDQFASVSDNASLSFGLIDNLVVSTPDAAVEGDYNNNGSVDAADYVLWRNGGPLANEVADPGTVSPDDYTEWRSRFGNPGSGSGMSSGTIPEPASAVLCALAMAGIVTVRRRR